MLIQINGYACELQLNIDKILDVKEGKGHKQYELVRKVNDDLLDAAMRNDADALSKALQGKAEPNAPRDMYELTPLHYAAHHGNVEMVQGLLDRSANAFAKDEDGRFPIHRSTLATGVLWLGVPGFCQNVPGAAGAAAAAAAATAAVSAAATAACILSCTYTWARSATL